MKSIIISYLFLLNLTNAYATQCHLLENEQDCKQKKDFCNWTDRTCLLGNLECESYETEDACPSNLCLWNQNECLSKDTSDCHLFKDSQTACLQTNNCEWGNEQCSLKAEYDTGLCSWQDAGDTCRAHIIDHIITEIRNTEQAAAGFYEKNSVIIWTTIVALFAALSYNYFTAPECVICTNKAILGGGSSLLSCTHGKNYCCGCLLSWFDNNLTCPECRSPARAWR